MEIILIIIVVAIIYFLDSGRRQNQNARLLEASKNAKAAREAYENERKLKEIKMSQIDGMDGHSFEYFVAELLRAKDFRNVKVTVGSGDFGVDITCEKDAIRIAVQCKRYAQPVSRRAISDAVAGKHHYNCTSAMVITNSYFTPKAIEFSKTASCKLIDRDKLKEWIFEIYGKEPIQDAEEYNDLMKAGEIMEEEINEISIEEPIINNKVLAHSFASPNIEDAKKISLKKAREEYPDDFSMQEYIYNEQMQDYKELQEILRNPISMERLKPAIAKIMSDYADDFSMQAYSLKEQLEAVSQLNLMLPEINRSPALQRTLSKVLNEYPDDFSMQQYEMEQQIESFRKMSRL